MKFVRVIVVLSGWRIALRIPLNGRETQSIHSSLHSVFTALAIMTQTVSLYVGLLKATNIVHGRMLAAVFRWPLVNFDTIPCGRIINRFGYDLDVLDNSLPRNVMQSLRNSGLVRRKGGIEK